MAKNKVFFKKAFLFMILSICITLRSNARKGCLRCDGRRDTVALTATMIDIAIYNLALYFNVTNVIIKLH